MSPKRSADFKSGQQAEILAAAKRCFIREGYDRTTLREVAREAGLSTGAIYTYFRTKAELLTAICREQAEAQSAALHDAFASIPASGERFTAAFTAALAPFLAVPAAQVRQRELLNLLFWYESTRDAALGDEIRKLMVAWHAAVLQQLRVEQATGNLYGDLDLDSLASILIALPFGLSIYDLLSGTSLDRRNFIRTLGAALERGVVPAKGPDS